MTEHKKPPQEIIRAVRCGLRLTQQEFAHQLGVAVSTVARWETGTSHPSRMALKLIELIQSGSGRMNTR